MELNNFCSNCSHKFIALALKCENCNYVSQEFGTVKQEHQANSVNDQSPPQWKSVQMQLTCEEFLPKTAQPVNKPKVTLTTANSKTGRKKCTATRDNTLDSKNRQIKQHSEQTNSRLEISKNPTYGCDKCNISFKRFTALKAHQARLHEADDEEEKQEGEQIEKVKLSKPSSAKLIKFQHTLKLATTDSDSDAQSEGVSSHDEIDIESMRTDLNTLYDSLTKIKQTPIGESVYKCRTCNKITLQLQDHLKHIITHTGCKDHVCVQCQEIFLSKKSLEEHLLKSHGDTNDEYLLCGMFKCKKCDNYFLCPAEWERHKRWHTGKQALIDCKICQVGFTCQKSLEKHNRVIHENTKNLPKKFKCFLCNERFQHLILLTNHKRTHPEFFKLIERTTFLKHCADGKKILYTCRTCGKSTYCQTNHFEHLQIHNSARPKFQCQLCLKQFTAQSTLNAHVRLHTDERPYRCEICEVSYRHRKSLRKHLQKHTGIRPVICQHCDSTFIDQNQCTEHVRRVHTGETPYQCDICSEWFTVFSHLPLHKLQKHNVDTRQKRTVDIIKKVDGETN